jgi:hypothetical protein
MTESESNVVRSITSLEKEFLQLDDQFGGGTSGDKFPFHSLGCLTRTD